MVRRRTRSDSLLDPRPALKAMEVCRQAMLDIHVRVRPFGTIYHGASMVITAIDAFATLLTGERYYFSTMIAPSTSQRPELHPAQLKDAEEEP